MMLSKMFKWFDTAPWPKSKLVIKIQQQGRSHCLNEAHEMAKNSKDGIGWSKDKTIRIERVGIHITNQ